MYRNPNRFLLVGMLLGAAAVACGGGAAAPPDAATPSLAPAIAAPTQAPESTDTPVPATSAPTDSPDSSMPASLASMDPGLTGLWSGTVDLAPSRADSAIGMSEIPWQTTVMLGACTPGKECGGWSNAGLNTSGWGIGCTSSLRYTGVDQGAFTFDEASTLKYGAITQCQGDCRLSLVPASGDRLDIQIGCQSHGYRVDAQGSLERVTGAP